MPSWARDATEFTVSVTKNVTCGTSYSYVPKPVLKKLGEPRYLTFKFKDGAVTVEAGRK